MKKDQETPETQEDGIDKTVKAKPYIKRSDAEKIAFTLFEQITPGEDGELTFDDTWFYVQMEVGDDNRLNAYFRRGFEPFHHPSNNSKTVMLRMDRQKYDKAHMDGCERYRAAAGPVADRNLDLKVASASVEKKGGLSEDQMLELLDRNQHLYSQVDNG